MATSGTTTFNLEFDDLIEEAYERCGLENRDGYDMKTAELHASIHFMELKSAWLIFIQLEMGHLISQCGGKKSG